MNLERILAENMLRFGVKNLTDAAKSKLNEQAKPSIEQQAYDAATKLGTVVWVKNFEETKNVIQTVPVSAQFYNNMVSYEKGMLPAGQKPFIDGLNNVVAAILNAKPETVRVTIIGQATDLAPKKEGYNWATKQTMPLDHDYDKVDIEQSPETGNKILATKRAETAKAQLIKLLGGKIPDIEKKITVTPRIVPGTISDDKLRMVLVEVSAATATQTPQWIDPTNLTVDMYMTFGWHRSGNADAGEFAQIGNDFKLQPALAYTVVFNYSTRYPAGAFGDSQVNMNNFYSFSSQESAQATYDYNRRGNTLPGGHTIDINGKQAQAVGQLRAETAIYGNRLRAGGNVSNDSLKLFLNFITSCGRFPSKAVYDNVFGSGKSLDGLLALVNKKASNAPASWTEFTQKFTPKTLSDFTGTVTKASRIAGDNQPVKYTTSEKPKTNEKVIDVQVKFTYDEFIDALGLNKNPVVDKTSTPAAYVIDKTVTPTTTQKVSAMPTPPGDLAASGVKIIRTNK